VSEANVTRNNSKRRFIPVFFGLTADWAGTRPAATKILMTDLKNICLAACASTTSIFTAIEAQTLITVISAIILPIFFFCVGKAVDVMVQVRLRQMADKRREKMRIDGRNM
jgi:hypothetical protein